MNLLSTVYSQSWPAPASNRHAKQGFYGKLTQGHKLHQPTKRSPSQTLRRNDPQSCQGKGIFTSQNRQSPRQSVLNLIPSRHSSLDQATYKWQTWTNFQEDHENDNNDVTLYKITQDTFRKLSAQVQEVGQHLSKYHTNGFKSFYSDGEKHVPVIRPTQLAANLPQRSGSISSSPAIDSAKIDQATVLQCKPIQTSQRRRPNSSVAVRHTAPELNQRPHSTTALNGSHATGDFDHLNPRIIHALGGENHPDIDPTHPGPFDFVSNNGKPDFTGSDNDSQPAPDSDKDSCKFRVRTPPNFDLPPEDLDVHGHRGRFLYRSSSASKKKQEPYPEALSKPYCYFDLLELSLLEKDWRNAVRAVPDGLEEKLIDRLIEMERLQIASVEWERGQEMPPSKRAASATQIRKGWNSVASLPTDRAQSALARPQQSKNCSSECLQPLCAGNCTNRQDFSNDRCPRCSQEYCKGSCTEFGYHLYVRRPRQEEKDPLPRPKSCKTCTSTRTSTQKSTINENVTTLGRPISAFATFSSTRQRVKKTRPVSAMAKNISGRMAKLGLSSTPDASGDRPSRPRTATSGGCSHSRKIGRDSLLPGKSFTSQRKKSLTDEPLSTSAAKMNSKPLRVKSARLKEKQRKMTKS